MRNWTLFSNFQEVLVTDFPTKRVFIFPSLELLIPA